MPEMSGFDLQQRLAVPVIFITSYNDDSTRERIKKSGAAGHLWKPFDEHAVLDAIRRAVGVDRDPIGTPSPGHLDSCRDATKEIDPPGGSHVTPNADSFPC